MLSIWDVTLQHPPSRWTWMLMMFILRREWWKGRELRGFVKISASCNRDGIWKSLITCYFNFSRIRWQSIWICFVLSCWIGFVAMDIADLLSVYSKVDYECLISRSCKAYKSHWISQVVVARARSTSAEDQLTVTCFFDFHEINELPRKIAKPMTLLVST